LRDDISENGPLHLESWKDQIIKAFGLGFYDALCEWKDMNIDSMYLAEHLQKHAETFKAPLPASARPPEGVEIIADPKQKLQMLIKLVDLQAQHLADLQHISSVAFQTRESAPNEFAPRYFATGSRDLQRAVDWYLYLTFDRIIFSSPATSIRVICRNKATKSFDFSARSWYFVENASQS